MVNRNVSIFTKAINIVVMIMMMILIKNNPDHNVLLSLGGISLLLVYFIGSRIGNKENLKRKLILYVLNAILISGIVSIDTTGLSIIIYLVMVGEIIVSTPFIVGIAVSFANYIFYIAIIYANSRVLNIYEISIITINFSIVYILCSGVRNEIVEKGKAQAVAKELEAKTKELEKAYERLQGLYEEKEEVILLKEKNRLAGEIHDTVGHILTTVVIELEASKRLIKRDTDLALEKLNLAQQQVKKGLDDIRKSVRAFKEGEELIHFIDVLKAFISEVERNSEVSIEYSFSEIPKVHKPIENIIYRALQEGITNGIRHGGSGHFEIMLSCEANNIIFILKDNGRGYDELKLGFGLYNMKTKVETAGGVFEIHSVVNEGVTISIHIPIAEGK